MISFLVGFALLIHICFWGAGLATLIMPAPWRRYWPVLIPIAGLSLQSVIVWLGAYADLPGTNHYAWFTLILPTLLLWLAVRQRGARAWIEDLRRLSHLWVVLASVLLFMLLPLSEVATGLTTVSLGSCDAADYAAGARTFMEFARSDRSGFMGLTEVVRVASTDNFYDFWLRLNHFTPSALIALNGTVFNSPPHQLTTLFTAVVLAGSLPLVFWLARTLFGLGAVSSVVIAALYGVSPITWYSYGHVSPAPLLAAQGIAAITWVGVALWNGRLSWARARRFSGVLLVAYGLVLGAYNFILVVALVPAVAYAGGCTLLTGRWKRLSCWFAALLAPLVAAGLIYWDRVAGVAERFRLFQSVDFGWKVPPLGPEGWLGMVQGGTLQPWWDPLRWALAVVFLLLLSWAVGRSIMARRWRGGWVIAATVPVLVGYAYLQLRGVLRGTNASYDAFKLFAVFLPVMLPAFCWWEQLRRAPKSGKGTLVLGFAGLVLALNLLACGMNIAALSRAPLVVDYDLRQIRNIEAMPDVKGVNVLLPDVWSRLWANVFLLRKEHYFPVQTYEGRLPTPLRGEWDLVSGPVRVDTTQGNTRPLSPHRRLIDTRSPRFLRTELGQGWYAEEGRRPGNRWTWTAHEATLTLTNPTDRALTVRVHLDGRTQGSRAVAIFREGDPAPPLKVGGVRATYRFPNLLIPPGRSTIVIRVEGGRARPARERRTLGICIYTLRLSPE